MRRDDWQLGTWGRIPVSMHWTVLLSAAWLYIIFQNVPFTLIGCVAMIVLMLVHEFGHVLALRRRKLGVTGIQLFGVHGETTYNVELNSVTLHFFKEEWDEFIQLVKPLVGGKSA